MKLQKISLAICLVLAMSTTAFAHPQHGLTGDGLVAGFSHPWLGLDHLLAMVAVGLLGVQLGGRAIWVLPFAFLGMMVVGGAMGVSSVPFRFVESGIALSVISLGGALAIGRKYPLVAAAIVIGLFGLMHGHAHGMEMPALAAPVLYAAGFVGATALLHLTGIAAGLCVVRSKRWATSLRFTGAAISLFGAAFLFGVL